MWTVNERFSSPTNPTENQQLSLQVFVAISSMFCFTSQSGSVPTILLSSPHCTQLALSKAPRGSTCFSGTYLSTCIWLVVLSSSATGCVSVSPQRTSSYSVKGSTGDLTMTSRMRTHHFVFIINLKSSPLINRVASIFKVIRRIHRPATLHGYTAGFRFRIAWPPMDPDYKKLIKSYGIMYIF